MDKNVGAGGVSCFSVSIFLRHSAEKIRRGNLLLFTNFGCRKIFMHKWGMSRFFARSFLSHSPENLPNGTLLCFRFPPVSKKFVDKKSGLGGVSRFFF